MITQVCGPNTVCSVAKDPRRKARNVQFRHCSNIPYTNNSEQEYKRQENNALWTSVTVALGAALFVAGCFLATGAGNIKK